jgi:hypothetical protein
MLLSKSCAVHLPDSVGAYHLVHRDSVSSFTNGIDTVAVVVQRISGPGRNNSSEDLEQALRHVVDKFTGGIESAQRAREFDSYRLAFSTRDSVTTTARQIPGWATAIVTKHGDILTFHLCYAFIAGDRVIEAITSIPADQLRTTLMPKFAHELVQTYAAELSRSARP